MPTHAIWALRNDDFRKAIHSFKPGPQAQAPSGYVDFRIDAPCQKSAREQCEGQHTARWFRRNYFGPSRSPRRPVERIDMKAPGWFKDCDQFGSWRVHFIKGRFENWR